MENLANVGEVHLKTVFRFVIIDIQILEFPCIPQLADSFASLSDDVCDEWRLLTLQIKRMIANGCRILLASG